MCKFGNVSVLILRHPRVFVHLTSPICFLFIILSYCLRGQHCINAFNCWKSARSVWDVILWPMLNYLVILLATVGLLSNIKASLVTSSPLFWIVVQRKPKFNSNVFYWWQIGVLSIWLYILRNLVDKFRSYRTNRSTYYIICMIIRSKVYISFGCVKFISIP